MTPLQEKELEILTAFDAVCAKLEIPYFLVCGSALGAVKYGGFIPWDDDVDVAMWRQDYERFLREAPKLLPEHLFLQHFRSDPTFPQIFAKLRDENTAFVEKTAAHLPMHHGIYIDIFPLDAYPADKKQQRRLERKKRRYRRRLSCAFRAKRTAAGWALWAVYRLMGCHRRTARIAERYERLVRREVEKSTAVVCNHGNWQGTLEYAPRSQYGAGKWMDFEHLTLRVPQDHDAYLTQKYGAWRTDPPPEQQVGHHDALIVDISRSYRSLLP